MASPAPRAAHGTNARTTGPSGVNTSNALRAKACRPAGNKEPAPRTQPLALHRRVADDKTPCASKTHATGATGVNNVTHCSHTPYPHRARQERQHRTRNEQRGAHATSARSTPLASNYKPQSRRASATRAHHKRLLTKQTTGGRPARETVPGQAAATRRPAARATWGGAPGQV